MVVPIASEVQERNETREALNGAITALRAAVVAVNHRRHDLEQAINRLEAAEQAVRLVELRETIDNLDCAGYIAHGSNETARKDRREKWMLDKHLDLLAAVDEAKRSKRECERLLKAAEDDLSFWKRCVDMWTAHLRALGE